MFDDFRGLVCLMVMRELRWSLNVRDDAR